MRTRVIQKILSRNDTGENSSHQAGILIPKKDEILSFFPEVDKKIKNPCSRLAFTDSFGERWLFSFIYYNNSFFGGTRNEYRLTGMTRFIKAYNLKAGDKLVMNRNENGFYTIEFSLEEEIHMISGEVLKLGNSWKIIKI